MNRSDLYPDLADLAKHTSYEQIFKLLYALSLSRYATFKQLHTINHRVATKKNLVKMVELGYLAQTENLQAYYTTPKTWETLKAEGYNIKIIHKTLEATDPKHELEITDALLKIYKEPDFYAVIYPNFTTLIPDACIVYKNESAYKLVFLEVENPKFNWEQYLKEKEKKYQELGKNEEIYSKWWKVWSENLKLPYCSINDFCFSVRVEK